LPESELYAAGRPLPQLLTSHNAAFGQSPELELVRADGTTIPVEARASATELGGKPAILGIFRDVRERREAAEVLRRSEERFEYLIQNLSDVITVVAVDGTMLYHSPSIERLAGYRPSELLGQSLLEYVHPEDEAGVRAALERVTLRVGSAAPPEYRFRHKDGSWIWLESVVNNLLNDVAVGGIVVTSRNVSARRVLEEQVRQSQKMEAVGRLGDQKRGNDPAHHGKRGQSDPAIAFLQPETCVQPAGARFEFAGESHERDAARAAARRDGIRHQPRSRLVLRERRSRPNRASHHESGGQCARCHA
jgi:PAS domain S-box-containing protein